jgi:hypothetical protein
MPRKKVKKELVFGDLYIALENYNFDWDRKDLLEFIRLWSEEYTLKQIAKFFKRDELECFLLYISLAAEDQIEPRLQLKYIS